MGKRSNFTPMNRFHEIIDHYGLKLMEVGVNHLRIFSEGRKLFDYYPLRMKLFDYRQWQQLTYPSLLGIVFTQYYLFHFKSVYAVIKVTSYVLHGFPKAG